MKKPLKAERMPIYKRLRQIVHAYELRLHVGDYCADLILRAARQIERSRHRHTKKEEG